MRESSIIAISPSPYAVWLRASSTKTSRRKWRRRWLKGVLKEKKKAA